MSNKKLQLHEMLENVFLKILLFGTKLTIPNSLILASMIPNLSKDEEAEIKCKLLQKGDIILTKTPSKLYETIRILGNSIFDHAVVVLSEKKVLHVSFPRIRTIHPKMLLSRNRRPIILRPKLNMAELELFITGLLGSIDLKYDYISLLTRITKVVIHSFGEQTTKPNGKNEEIEWEEAKNICTDVIFDNLWKCSKFFRESIQLEKKQLDLYKQNALTLNDFLHLGYNSVFFEIIHAYDDYSIDISPPLPPTLSLPFSNFLNYRRKDLKIGKSVILLDKLNVIYSEAQKFKNYQKYAAIGRMLYQAFKYIFFIMYHQRNKNVVKDIKEISIILTQIIQIFRSNEIRECISEIIKIMVIVRKYVPIGQKEKGTANCELKKEILDLIIKEFHNSTFTPDSKL